MPDQELAAQAVIEQAKLQGGRRVSGEWVKVRAGQAGRLIVREARAMRAQAVLLPLPQRGTSGSLFPKTIETVLAERPTRVVLVSEPSGRKRPTTGSRARPVPVPGVGGGP
jgi:APA family basic amino acid/polyamine antiporter